MPWGHTVNTVTFKKTKDLQNIIRHAGHRKSQSHTLQVRWLDILNAMKEEVILHVHTHTDILSFQFYYIWYILQENEQKLQRLLL